MAEGWHTSCHPISKTHIVGEGPGETPLALRCLYLINSFLTDRKQLAKTSMEGTLSPLLMSMSEAFSVPFFTSIKLCYITALEWSSLVPSPKAKSSLEITNPIPFTTVSYHPPTSFPSPCYSKHWTAREFFLFRNWSAVDLQLTSVPPNPRTFWRYFISFSISSHPLPIFLLRSFVSEIKEISIFFLMNCKSVSQFVVGVGFSFWNLPCGFFFNMQFNSMVSGFCIIVIKVFLSLRLLN